MAKITLKKDLIEELQIHIRLTSSQMQGFFIFQSNPQTMPPCCWTLVVKKSLINLSNLQNFVARNPSSLIVVKNVLNVATEGPPDFVLVHKLNVVKFALKIRNRLHFGHIQTHIKELNQQFITIQKLDPSEDSMLLEDSLVTCLNE